MTKLSASMFCFFYIDFHTISAPLDFLKCMMPIFHFFLLFVFPLLTASPASSTFLVPLVLIK